MKRILVSYHAKKGCDNIIGNVVCDVKKFPVSESMIREIETEISNVLEFDNTVLLNVILLR